MAYGFGIHVALVYLLIKKMKRGEKE